MENMKQISTLLDSLQQRLIIQIFLLLNITIFLKSPFASDSLDELTLMPSYLDSDVPSIVHLLD